MLTLTKPTIYTYRKYRAKLYRLKRVVFMSPAEARFIEIMGGAVITLPILKLTENGFPFTLVLTMGRTLRTEKFKREVRFGKYTTDFANDLNRIIEIDGQNWHDVVADMERDEYIARYCPEARILRIKAKRLYSDIPAVKKEVFRFLR